MSEQAIQIASDAGPTVPLTATLAIMNASLAKRAEAAAIVRRWAQNSRRGPMPSSHSRSRQHRAERFLDIAARASETISILAGDVPKLLIQRMRTSDRAITPFVDDLDGQPRLLESMIFAGGRRVLVLPREPPPTATLGTIVVAWDAGRAAAPRTG